MSGCRNDAWEIAKKTLIKPLPNNAISGCSRVQIVTPFGTFTPTTFCMAVLQNLCGRAVPRPGVGAPMVCLLQSCLSSHHGPVAFGGPDDHEPAHLVLDASRQSTGGAGTMQAGNTRGLFCLVAIKQWSHHPYLDDNGFDSKWVAHSPDHVYILFNPNRLHRALLNLLNFLLDAFHSTIPFLLPR